MKLIILKLLVIGYTTIITNSSLAQELKNRPDFALVGAKIYSSPTSKVIKDGSVLIRNGKIVAVGNSSQIRIPKDMEIIDCKGLVLTSSFWNCHVHFMEPKWEHADSLPASQLSKQLEDMLTRYGYAHVFDLATLDLQNLLSLRARIKTGEVTGPEVYTAGVPFTPPDGSPFYIEPLKLPEMATPLEAENYVKKQIESGSDAIKIWSASPAHGRIVDMPIDIAKKAIEVAHHLGKPVFAHPTNNAGVRIAVESGIDILAHTAPDDRKAWDSQTIKAMLDRKMAIIPTLKLYKWDLERLGKSTLNDPLITTAVEQLGSYSNAGGQILFGTDVGFMSDYSPSDEYKLMASAGMSFMQILAALTTAPAERFRVSSTGRIAVGMDADLVLLNGDPETDISSLSKVVYTIHKGKIIYSNSVKKDQLQP